MFRRYVCAADMLFTRKIFAGLLGVSSVGTASVFNRGICGFLAVCPTFTWSSVTEFSLP